MTQARKRPPTEAQTRLAEWVKKYNLRLYRRLTPEKGPKCWLSDQMLNDQYIAQYGSRSLRSHVVLGMFRHGLIEIEEIDSRIIVYRLK